MKLKVAVCEKRYFITVDWCGKGPRGIFCDRKGRTFSQEKPFTRQEMEKVLDVFWLVLDPKSEAFSKEETKDYTVWRPLAEYKNQYGIALKGE